MIVYNPDGLHDGRINDGFYTGYEVSQDNGVPIGRYSSFEEARKAVEPQ